MRAAHGGPHQAYNSRMHIAGLVLSLFLANAPITPIAQHPSPSSTPAVTSAPAEPSLIPEGVPMHSPDPAPPHALKPRVPLEAPASGLARIAMALAKGIMRDHGR